MIVTLSLGISYEKLGKLLTKYERVLEKSKYPVYNLLRSNQKTLVGLMIALRINS